MKILIFDLRGDYGHFGVYFSTTSPITFSVIPPTALVGVLGAILGLPKEENNYLQVLNQAGISASIALNNPVKKVNMGINLIKTKGNVWIPVQRKEGARTQITYEFLKEPSYRIYLTCSDETVFRELERKLKGHETVYTVSLGLSELIADFEYIGTFECRAVSGSTDFVIIDSIVPIDMILENGINVLTDMMCIKERIPQGMDKKRVVQNYREFLIETRGMPLEIKVNKHWECNGKNIILIDLASEVYDA
jgi:CRISPR-associated protein Cas5h